MYVKFFSDKGYAQPEALGVFVGLPRGLRHGLSKKFPLRQVAVRGRSLRFPEVFAVAMSRPLAGLRVSYLTINFDREDIMYVSYLKFMNVKGVVDVHRQSSPARCRRPEDAQSQGIVQSEGLRSSMFRGSYAVHWTWKSLSLGWSSRGKGGRRATSAWDREAVHGFLQAFGGS